MCWAEKCCYFVPANLGCILIGVCSFILSTFMLVASIVCYILETKEESELLTPPRPYLSEILGLKLNLSSVHIILSTAIIVAILWMMFSGMLVIGVIKNKSSFILSYFTFGIIITIFCLLSALLILLRNCWIMAIVLFIISLIHIHFLVLVHTVYELMQRGKNFSLHQHHGQDEDPLVDRFDEDIDRI